MDDMIYRHNSIAEENIDPHGHPGKNKFEAWSETVSEHTSLGYKESKEPISDEEREKRIKEMDEIIKKELE